VHFNNNDIKIISKNSNLQNEQISWLLDKKVYTKPKDWYFFLNYFSLSIGLGFLATGILFFFAYNWQDLHKFIKLGILEFLVVVTISAGLYWHKKPILSNILITVATLLTGVLFAVFGQIYQTGANAYDFFKGWTFAVSLWVLVSNFEPLWLLFIALINITYFMFTKQIATDWSDSTYFLILLLLNFSVTGMVLFLKQKFQIATWFIKVITAYAILAGTIAVITGIMHRRSENFLFIYMLVLGFYLLLNWYAVKQKNIWIIALTLSGMIAIFISLLLKRAADSSIFFLTGIFTVISVTALIKLILFLQKKWYDKR